MFMFEPMIVFNHLELFDRSQHFLASVYLSQFLRGFVCTISAALRESERKNSPFLSEQQHGDVEQTCSKCSCLLSPIRKGKLSGGKCRSRLKYMFDFENCSPDLRPLMTSKKVTVCIFVKIPKEKTQRNNLSHSQVSCLSILI